MTEPANGVEDQPEPLSATVLCVRYKGSADVRTLTRADLSGDRTASNEEAISWTPKSEVEWERWLDLSGGRARAIEILTLHSAEFEIVGPGADEFAASFELEEFSFEESAE